MGRTDRLTQAIRCSECKKVYYDENFVGEPCRNCGVLLE